MLLLAAAPAAAQDGWDFAFTPYVWLPSLTNKLHTDTRFGTIESSTSGEDTLSDLDMAFMAAFEARHGRIGLVADLLYVDLSSEEDTPFGELFDSVKTEVKGTALSGYALYRVVEEPQVAFDVGAGFRAYWLSFDTTLEPGTLPGRDFDLSENWVDPLIAVRGIVSFSDRWSANAVVDYGGFDGENDSTFQALASVNYAINDQWTIRGGWRYLDIQKEINGLKIESELSGPIIGVGFHF
jgi:opacity protein-like surface antigen